MQVHIDLSGVPETLLITLYCSTSGSTLTSPSPGWAGPA